MPVPITPGVPVVLQVNRVDLGLRRGQFARVLSVDGAGAVVECLGENGLAHTRLHIPASCLLPIVCEPIPDALLTTIRVPPRTEAMLADADVGTTSLVLGVSRLARLRA